MLTNLKLQRLRSRMLQIQLATRAGISRSRLSELEQGHVQPRPDEIARLASVLKVRPRSLRCGVR